jgi:hypothetical protein
MRPGLWANKSRSRISMTACRGESKADRASWPGTRGTAILDYELGANYKSVGLEPFTQGQAPQSRRPNPEPATSCYDWSWRGLHRRTTSGSFGFQPPGHYATFNSNHTPDGTPDGDRLAVRNYLYPYARVIARALAARVAEEFRVKF